MENIINYIKNHWLLLSIGMFFLTWFLYLTYAGNQLCDCEKTETYKDGTVRNNSTGKSFYRYYHK